MWIVRWDESDSANLVSRQECSVEDKDEIGEMKIYRGGEENNGFNEAYFGG